MREEIGLSLNVYCMMRMGKSKRGGVYGKDTVQNTKHKHVQANAQYSVRKNKQNVCMSKQERARNHSRFDDADAKAHSKMTMLHNAVLN